MSHEMRTPMNAIIGMTKIAEKTDDVSRLKYCLSTINTSSVHLLGIINDVLDMSKIEAGKFELENIPMNIEKMLMKVCNIISDNIEKKNQKLNMTLAKDLNLDYIADDLRLSQVITNLLSNAVKFTPENGKITLVVEKTGTKENVNTLRFSVTDTGIGMTKEQTARLFNAFEQADGSISRKFGGTGLGLAISKHIVEKMGGRIWVESEQGSGSSFIFEVDLERMTGQELKSLEIKTDTPAETPDLSGVNIILAEDMEINREIFIALLEDTHITIDIAENGLAAVSKFRENPEKYDLIIMDVQMPEMDGYQATRTIRAMDTPKAKNIPIIAMTANAFKEDVDRCLEAGMNDHLPKPIDEKTVIEKIAKVVTHTKSAKGE
jgi:CheY-like chemotaxis protein/two-component sensor histidine kinase